MEKQFNKTLPHNPFYVDIQTNRVSKVSEIRATYQTKVKLSESPIIKRALDTYVLLSEFYLPYLEFKEVCMLILLNRAHKVKGVYKVSEGSIGATLIDPKEIFSIMKYGIFYLMHKNYKGLNKGLEIIKSLVI